MMLCIGYKSKKELKANVGKPLCYQETSMFGEEYTPNGEFIVAHRPILTTYNIPKPEGREFFAKVKMVDGLIAKVT